MKPIALNTPDAEARKMTASGEPSLDARNAKRAAHPLIKASKIQRQMAVANMLSELADRIRADAHLDEFFEETEHHWTDKFFQCAVQQGIMVHAHIGFSRPLDIFDGAITGDLKIRVLAPAHHFQGCEPLPLEVELVNDIPSEEP